MMRGLLIVMTVMATVDSLVLSLSARRFHRGSTTRMMAGDDPLSRIGRIAKGKLDDVSGTSPGIKGVNPVLGGAVIGGLIGGPFGLLLGIGAGNSLANEQAAAKEMEKLGLNKKIIAEAQALAKTLQDAQAASEAALDARETTRLRALSLDKKYEELQEQALEALRGGDDDTARDNLREKAQVETQRSNAVGDFKTARDRCERIDADISVLKGKVEEFDALILRSARQAQGGGAGSFEYDMPTSLAADAPSRDPLLEKFAEMERQIEEKKRREAQNDD